MRPPTRSGASSFGRHLLPDEFQAELDQPWIDFPGRLAEIATRNAVRKVGARRAAGQFEVGMIQGVEHLETELQIVSLRRPDVLKHGLVRIPEARPLERVSGQISIASSTWRGEQTA